MAKYIVQHRRATRAVLNDKNGLIPKAGEIIIEFDDEKSLHRLKIGDGVHTYKDLSYLMAGDEILTQALPNIIEITLDKDGWAEDGSDPVCYCQEVVVEDASKNSRLDLQPDVDMLAEFQKLGLVFTTKNVDGVISVCSVGSKPTSTYTMQATLVAADVLSDCDKVLGTPIGASASIEETNARVSDLELQMASISNMLYEPITIKSFSPSPSKAEKGDTVNNPKLVWTTSKTPTSMVFNGEQIDVNDKNKQIEGSFDMNNPGSWTLTVTDERGASDTETTSIAFYNAVYYGSIPSDSTIDNDTILELGKSIRGSMGGSFKTTQPSQRGIFVCPTTYGSPQFKIGEMPLPYTWEKVNNEPFVLTNHCGYMEPSGYDIWRSYQNIEAKGTNITVI